MKLFIFLIKYLLFISLFCIMINIGCNKNHNNNLKTNIYFNLTDYIKQHSLVKENKLLLLNDKDIIINVPNNAKVLQLSVSITINKNGIVEKSEILRGTGSKELDLLIYNHLMALKFSNKMGRPITINIIRFAPQMEDATKH